MEFFCENSSRSSRPEVSCKKGVLRNFTKFTGKHLCQRLFFNKVAGLRPQAYEISKNIFFYRTPLVAASVVLNTPPRHNNNGLSKIQYHYLNVTSDKNMKT